jgi:hypothetical protein
MQEDKQRSKARSKIKTGLRAIGARTVAMLMSAVGLVASYVTPVDAAGWFKHCNVTKAQPA